MLRIVVAIFIRYYLYRGSVLVPKLTGGTGPNLDALESCDGSNYGRFSFFGRDRSVRLTGPFV